MMGWIYSIILNFVDIGTMWFVISRFSEMRIKTRWGKAGLFVVLALLNTFIVVQFPKPIDTIISLLAILISVIIGFKKFIPSITLPWLVWILTMLTELGTMMFISLLTNSPTVQVPSSNPLISVINTMISRLTLLGISIILFRKNKVYISRKVTFFQIILVISGALLLFSLFATYYNIMKSGKQYEIAGVIISIILLVIFLILIFTAFYKIQIEARNEKELALAEEHENMILHSLQQIKMYAEEISINKHDIRHQRSLTQNMIKAGMTDLAMEYYEQTEEQLSSLRGVIVNAPYINVILFEYIRHAEEEGFDFQYHVPRELNMNVAIDDLSRILLNILDNALKTVRKLSTEKYIYLDIKEYESVLSIACSNPCEEEVKNVLNLLPKDGHGYGLKSVQKIAEKYNGRVWTENKDGVFKINIDLSEK